MAAARPSTTPVLKVARLLEGQAAVHAIQQFLSVDAKTSPERNDELFLQVYELFSTKTPFMQQHTFPLIAAEFKRQKLLDKPIAELNGRECLLIGLYLNCMGVPTEGEALRQSLSSDYLTAAEEKGEVQSIFVRILGSYENWAKNIESSAAAAEKKVEQSRSGVLAAFLMRYYQGNPIVEGPSGRVGISDALRRTELARYMKLAKEYGDPSAMVAAWLDDKRDRGLLEAAAIKGDAEALLQLGHLKKEEKDLDAAAAYYRFCFEKGGAFEFVIDMERPGPRLENPILGRFYRDNPNNLAVIYHTALATRNVDSALRNVDGNPSTWRLAENGFADPWMRQFRNLSAADYSTYLTQEEEKSTKSILGSFNNAFREHPNEMMALLKEFDSLDRVRSLLEPDVLKQVEAALKGSDAKLFATSAAAGAAAAAPPGAAPASPAAGGTPAAPTAPTPTLGRKPNEE